MTPAYEAAIALFEAAKGKFPFLEDNSNIPMIVPQAVPVGSLIGDQFVKAYLTAAAKG